jgi:hypothetical protein
VPDPLRAYGAGDPSSSTVLDPRTILHDVKARSRALLLKSPRFRSSVGIIGVR